MNHFERHHRDSIAFGYSCFDRMIFNGYIRSFQYPTCGGSIRWFLCNKRQGPPLSRAHFGRISADYHKWVGEYAQGQGIDIIRPDKNARREELVQPYFQRLGHREGVAVILRARESERIAWYYAKSNEAFIEHRFVDLYYFYLYDISCGPMFVRICPYFPFNVRVWLNGHNWLANQLSREDIAFRTRDNMFTACANPHRLQELSDAFSPADIVRPVELWLARLLPYFTQEEREQGFRHQLYMSQMEYCHNLLFHKRAAVDRLFDRLVDANRGMGHPDKLAIVFGRAGYRPDTRTGQTVLKVIEKRIPTISSSYKATGVKQYVKDGAGLRTESSTHQLQDLSIPKHIDNLEKVRTAFDSANHRYLQVQQDILQTYVDRGQLEQLRQPSVSTTGRRVPGLHIDDPRLLAVLNAILCFAYLVGKGRFRTKDLLADVQTALRNPQYKMSQLRYDLSKLRGKGLVTRLNHTQEYQVSSEGYCIGVYYLKLYQKMYAPVTAAICEPVKGDVFLPKSRHATLDQLYVAIDKALHNLADHLGMAA